MNRERLLALLGASIVLVLAVWTWQRNAVWGDEMSLWTDAIEKAPSKGRSYYNRGTVYHNAYHDMETAMVFYKDCLKREPDCAVAYSSLANNLRVLGDAPGALACALTAVTLEPDEALHWYNLGRVYMMTGEYRAARGFFGKAIEIDKMMFDARVDSGRCHEELDEWEEAADVYTELLSWDSEDMRGHYHLGVCLSHIAQIRPLNPEDRARLLRDAEYEFGWTLERNVLFPDGHLGIGEVFVATGRYDLAVLHFKQAVRLAEGDGELRKHLLNGLSGLAFSLHSLGRRVGDPTLTDRAASVYERLLRENPDSVEARVDLALIEARERGNRPRAEALLAQCEVLDLTRSQRAAVQHARDVLSGKEK